MNRLEKLNKLESIKQKYILIRNCALYCKSVNNNLDNKNKEKQVVKTLVLTKPFYGKQLRVG